MQTPLAILRSKLDLMIQEPGLNESQTRQVQAMYQALARMTKLNQSLLLLTKIENNQFSKTEIFPLDQLVREKLLQFEELAAAQGVEFETELEEIPIRMNHYLADTLLNNLIGNAVRHNKKDGRIIISLREGQFRIANTGVPEALPGEYLYQRFHKGERSEGVGLGLAIVKQICDHHALTIQYSFRSPFHEFRISIP
jgi:signal transduction histidine kinase